MPSYIESGTLSALRKLGSGLAVGLLEALATENCAKVDLNEKTAQVRTQHRARRFTVSLATQQVGK